MFKSWLTRLNEHLVKYNQDRLIMKVGKKGTGKSNSSLIEGQEIVGADYFTPRKHVAYFAPWEFTRKVGRAKKGDFLVWDDVGVGLDNRDWGKKSNKYIVKLIQVMRTKNLMIEFTAVDFGDIDVKARKKFDYFVEMKTKTQRDFPKGISIARWYEIQKDGWSGDMYRKTLNIGGYEVSDVTYPLVDSDTKEEYDEERNRAFDRVFKTIDEHQRGEDKAVPIEQAAKLLQMDSRILYSLVRQGQIPTYAESSYLKISMGWIKKVDSKINLVDPFTQIDIISCDLAKELKLKNIFAFNNGTALFKKDKEYIKKEEEWLNSSVPKSS